MAAVAAGMLEYTLDVVKLEPGETNYSFKTRPKLKTYLLCLKGLTTSQEATANSNFI